MTETSTICHPNDIVKIFNFTTGLFCYIHSSSVSYLNS